MQSAVSAEMIFSLNRLRRLKSMDTMSSLAEE